MRFGILLIGISLKSCIEDKIVLVEKCHCEKRSDEAISLFSLTNEIATDVPMQHRDSLAMTERDYFDRH
jgi:hypothetical protein